MALHQLSPTPVYGVASVTRFELKEPYYIDVNYRATPTHNRFTSNFLGIFWASYKNAPEDKSIYFRGTDSPTARPAGSNSLPNSTAATPPSSPFRYTKPFFYGRIGDLVLIYIFQPNPHRRRHQPRLGFPTSHPSSPAQTRSTPSTSASSTSPGSAEPTS